MVCHPDQPHRSQGRDPVLNVVRQIIDLPKIHSLILNTADGILQIAHGDPDGILHLFHIIFLKSVDGQNRQNDDKYTHDQNDHHLFKQAVGRSAVTLFPPLISGHSDKYCQTQALQRGDHQGQYDDAFPHLAEAVVKNTVRIKAAKVADDLIVLVNRGKDHLRPVFFGNSATVFGQLRKDPFKLPCCQEVSDLVLCVLFLCGIAVQQFPVLSQDKGTGRRDLPVE